MLDINGTLFFTLWRDDTCTLYQSDGTDANTRLIKRIDEGCAFHLIGQEQRLFFATATEKPDIIRCTLWASEGTGRDTEPIIRFQTKPGSNCIRDMVMLDDKLIMLLTERGKPNNELWISDGTIDGTVFVRQIPGIFIENLNLRILFVSGRRVFFSSGAGTGTLCQLWVSDGTPAGTQLVRDGFTFGKDSWRPRLLLVDGKTLFLAIHDDRGCAVWRSDGTAAGTVELQRGCPDELVSVNGTLFFVMSRNKREIELWKNDGTGTGATLIKVIP